MPRSGRQGRPRLVHAECVAEKQRAYREANREEIAEKQRAYREANREEIAEKKRAYYEANREEIAEKQRAYYEANREEIAEKQRAYREANREEIAEKQRAYYAALRERIGDLIDEALDESDFVAVEDAADTVLSGATVTGLHRSDRLAAAVDVMRRGARSPALLRLGFSGGYVAALLGWWDSLNVSEDVAS